MVIYDLECELGHRFEVWFKDASSFAKQKKAQLIQCSFCGNHTVKKIPSGIHIGKQQIGRKSKQRQQTITQKPTSLAIDPLIILKSLHHHLKKNYQDVGENFVEKAIAMHKGEIPSVPIYGNVENEGREKLEQENVPYITLPKLPDNLDH